MVRMMMMVLVVRRTKLAGRLCDQTNHGPRSQTRQSFRSFQSSNKLGRGKYVSSQRIVLVAINGVVMVMEELSPGGEVCKYVLCSM